MNPAPAAVPGLALHLERAAQWRLLAQLLSCPDAGWRGRLELLLECITDQTLLGIARHALRESAPQIWLRWFSPAGPVHLRAVAWEGGLQPGYLLSELSAYYGAFAYSPPADCAPDELGVLLDFAAWLELKAAYACASNDSSALEVTGRALESFLARFVAPTAWPVFRQLEQFGAGFFTDAARLAAERAGPEPSRPPSPELPWPDECSSGDFSCGHSPNLVRFPGQTPDDQTSGDPD